MAVALHLNQQAIFAGSFSSSFFGFMDFGSGSASDITASVLAYISIILCIVIPIFPTIFLYRSKEQDTRFQKIEDFPIYFENIKRRGSSPYFEPSFNVRTPCPLLLPRAYMPSYLLPSIISSTPIPS